MLRHVRPILLLSGLLWTIPACSDSGADPGGAGQFDVTVTTTSVRSMSGFAVSSGANGVGWSMTFTTPGGGEGMLWITEGAGRPAPGSYRIVDLEATDASPAPGDYVATVNMDGTDHDLQSVTGTLTITSSTESAVSGQFSFSGKRGNTGQTGTVEGTFTTMNRDDAP